MKRYKSTTILGGGPPGKIVQCQSFKTKTQSNLENFKFVFSTSYKNYKINHVTEFYFQRILAYVR